MPGKSFNGKRYWPVQKEGVFMKEGRAKDQATRIRRSGYCVRVIEEAGRFVLYARTKNGRPIPVEWKKVNRPLAWKRGAKA